MSQLLSIAHKIFKGSDANLLSDTCGIFFDIFKAFDRVWHEALIFKLGSYGISDSLLCLFNRFLPERLQRVVLNGQASEWQKVLAGVPQGSILGPLLFLIFIDDIPANFKCNVKIFADDTSLFSVVCDPNENSGKLDKDLGRVAWCTNQWKMSFDLLFPLSKMWRFTFPIILTMWIHHPFILIISQRLAAKLINI